MNRNKHLALKQPTLHLFCGLPGAGKTTLAKKIESETGAIRLCPDEWMGSLGIDMFDDVVRDKLEWRLWRLAMDLLRQGQSVIVENGFWTRGERDERRKRARKLGVKIVLHYMDVPFEELLRRISVRNTQITYDTVPLTQKLMEEYVQIFEPVSEEEMRLFD
jgi:predicted kinase